VLIASFAARIPIVPDVTMMSTLSRTRSWARALRRWGWPSAHRYSIATVWPSIQPRSRRPRRNANELLVVCCCGVPVAEKTNPGDCALLRVGDHRHEHEDDEGREPDQPHGHLDGGWLAGV